MASIGPFSSFAFPGVYTETLNEAPQVTAAAGLRVPAFIGVADEVIPVTAYEMIRGSSSMADNSITKEEISSTITYPIDGSNRSFQVSFFPITTGNGTGTPTTNPNNVTAYVNAQPVPVAAVNGVEGIVSLVTPPLAGDLLEISYFFKRIDTLHTNEDLSDQANGVNKVFKTDFVPIVLGNNGGVTSTDPTTVTVKVGTTSQNAAPVPVSALDGASGTITLAAAPGSGKSCAGHLLQQ